MYVTAWDAPDKSTEKNVYSYDVEADYWTELPKPGHRRGVLQMLDDNLTIFGGDNPYTKEALNKVTTYNATTRFWYKLYPDMLNKRFKPGILTYQGYVIVMGGKRGLHGIHSSIELMDYQNLRQWKQVSLYLPVPMWNIKPIISGDSIVIVGYSDSKDRSNAGYQIAVQNVLSSCQTLHSALTLTQWTKLPSPTYHEATVVPYSNPIVIIGGISHAYYSSSAATSDVTLYDASKNSWRKVDSLTSGRDCVGVALIDDNTIIIIGGTIEGYGVKDAKECSLTTVEIGRIVPKH